MDEIQTHRLQEFKPDNYPPEMPVRGEFPYPVPPPLYHALEKCPPFLGLQLEVRAGWCPHSWEAAPLHSMHLAGACTWGTMNFLGIRRMIFNTYAFKSMPNREANGFVGFEKHTLFFCFIRHIGLNISPADSPTTPEDKP